jgi:hypothetical protein
MTKDELIANLGTIARSGSKVSASVRLFHVTVKMSKWCEVMLCCFRFPCRFCFHQLSMFIKNSVVSIHAITVMK